MDAHLRSFQEKENIFESRRSLVKDEWETSISLGKFENEIRGKSMVCKVIDGGKTQNFSGFIIWIIPFMNLGLQAILLSAD